MLQKIVRRLAASHIAGSSIESALDVSRRAVANGWSTTLCIWNGPDGTPALLFQEYRSLIEALQKETGNFNLSLKTPSFHYDLELLRQIIILATKQKIGIEFDSHGPESADRTLNFAQQLRPHCDRMTCSMPARWARSVQDADWAVEHRIGVRIVKGQWNDPEAPGLDYRENYFNIIDRLASRDTKVFVATHQPSLAREALHRLKQSGTPCELEVMFSLPLEVTKIAERMDVPVRVFIPFGYPYLPYNISDAHTRPAIALWGIRNFLVGRPPRQYPLYK